jgi:preprotein translocase subunit Sss1
MSTHLAGADFIIIGLVQFVITVIAVWVGRRVP